jgi:probable F420-dependent oxidoreductase
VKGHNELRYSTPWTAGPGPRLREYLQVIKAIFDGFTSGKAQPFEGQHYKFSLLPPFFSPGPIDYPAPPIYIAAVNTYMAKLGGELCDGLPSPPDRHFSYTNEVVLPAIAAGAPRVAARSPTSTSSARRSSPSAPMRARYERRCRRSSSTSRSTPRRAPTTPCSRSHGWEDVGLELHRLSREGKWQEMPALITDDMLAEWAIIATYDQLAAELRARCDGIFSTLLLDLPHRLRRDEARVRELVQTLRG